LFDALVADSAAAAALAGVADLDGGGDEECHRELQIRHWLQP